MKYPYAIKYNGVYYSANEEIPEKAAEETPLPFSDSEIVFDTQPVEKKYTRTEISRMNVAKLREMAMNTGVEGADSMTGAELKKYLFAAFGL